MYLKQRVVWKDFLSQLGTNFRKLLSLSQVSYFCWNDVFSISITITETPLTVRTKWCDFPSSPGLI